MTLIFKFLQQKKKDSHEVLRMQMKPERKNDIFVSNEKTNTEGKTQKEPLVFVERIKWRMTNDFLIFFFQK